MHLHCIYYCRHSSNQEKFVSRSLPCVSRLTPMCMYSRHSDHEKLVPRSLPAPPLAVREHVVLRSLPTPPSAAPNSCSKLALVLAPAEIGEASSGRASTSGALSFRQTRIVSERDAGAPDAGELLSVGTSGRNQVSWPELLLRCREPGGEISRDEIEQEVAAPAWPKLVAASTSEISSPEISSLERRASSADDMVAAAETMVAEAEAKAEAEMEVIMEAVHRAQHEQAEAAALSHTSVATEVSEGEGDESEIGREHGEMVLFC